jgi:hypothetical protein
MAMDVEQEKKWAEELLACRKRLIARIKLATSMSSPTKRYALYTEWRKEHGDDTARESAKISEAVLEGRFDLRKLERMVK